MRAALQIADRARFASDIQQLFESQNRAQWAVASIDIRRFSLFNIWYGKENGDKVLSSIAEYLLNLHDTKGYPVGYLGDDDFLICLPNKSSTVKGVYDGVQECVDSQDVPMNFYVVMGVCPVENYLEADPFTLYNYARIAATETHYKGGRHLYYFNDENLRSIENYHRLGTEINRAFEKNEFVMYLQPQQNSISNRIIGFEALARWNHPERGILEPEVFMSVLEQNGKAVRLDLYMWRQACALLARWKYEKRNIVPISVNVSLADIENIDVAKALLSLVHTYDLDPALLEVEITETVLIGARGRVSKTVKELRSKGFTVLIDDFGSGYSSLGMLKDIQADVLKLDMSLIDFSQENYKRGVSILQAITNIAHQLEIPLIAEGAQTLGQVSVLQSMNCLYIQGFYFHESLPVCEAEKLLTREGTPEYWDIKKDYAGRTINELGDVTVDDSSALMLRSFRIYSDNLLFNGLLNLESGVLHVAHCSDKLVRSSMANEKGFADYCEEAMRRKLIFSEDIPRLYEILPLEKLREHFYDSREAYSFRYRELTTDGYKWVTADIISAADCAPGNAWVVISLREDLLAEQLVSELNELYIHDIQTGALNRNKYEQDIVQLAEGDADHIAVAYFDANGLHEINNTLGHAAGDAMLQSIVDTLTEQFGSEHVYRIGGDEFVVIVPNGTQEMLQIGIEILGAKLQEQDYTVSAGLAIAACPQELSAALIQAETAMRLDKMRFSERSRTLLPTNSKHCSKPE